MGKNDDIDVRIKIRVFQLGFSLDGSRENPETLSDCLYIREDIREGGVVEILVIREKNEAMKWLAEHGRKLE